MGGHAYVISGQLTSDRLAEAERPVQPPPPPIWQRLFGVPTRAVKGRRVAELPNGDRLIEIPAAPLEAALVGDLRSWLDERMPHPSRGTSVVLEYMSGVPPTVYVRGLQRANMHEPAYYVQVTFSGCAGQAETSARAVAHWAAAWYAAEHDRIAAAHLTPFGFLPALDVQGEDEPMVFLPAGDLGYLEYIPPDARGEGQAAFEIDQAVVEAYEGSPLLTRLNDVFEGYMRDAVCRCQLCDPEFGDAAIDAG
jgi:hypothetical protein